MIHHGDCLDVMAAMPEASVDAVVCDPPYGIGFMSKSWDELATAPNEARWNKRGRNTSVATAAMRGEEGIENFRHSVTGAGFAEPNPRCALCGKVRQGTPKHVCQCGDDWVPAPRVNRQAQRSQEWHQRWATEAFRVAKPGAYLLAFGGTRTYHRLAVAIEDAGWIIRDCLVWAYASGFPKSRSLLKPAWEPIVMARKPGPLRELAIDACRIGFTSEADREDNAAKVSKNPTGVAGLYGVPGVATHNPAGRWPANVILTETPDGGGIFDGGWDGVVGGGTVAGSQPIQRPEGFQRFDGTDYNGGDPYTTSAYTSPGYGDTGTYSRFFLIPKAARSDREPNAYGQHAIGAPEASGATSWDKPLRECNVCGSRTKPAGPNPEHWPACGHDDWRWEMATPKQRINQHPTVKPLELMRHLVRLVTPTGGTVLDPFLGSGSTAIAAEMEGFAWLGIEREAEYVAIAEARLQGVQRGLGLDVAAPTPRMPNTHPDLSKHQPKRRAPSENWSGAWAGTDEDVA